MPVVSTVVGCLLTCATSRAFNACSPGLLAPDNSGTASQSLKKLMAHS